MDINNSLNIQNQVLANQVSASISKLNLNTAKKTIESNEKQNENIKQLIKEDDVKLMDTKPINNAQNKIDVADIQKYANYMGENLSIDDINYGLMYGRSVIADYCV